VVASLMTAVGDLQHREALPILQSLAQTSWLEFTASKAMAAMKKDSDETHHAGIGTSLGEAAKRFVVDGENEPLRGLEAQTIGERRFLVGDFVVARVREAEHHARDATELRDFGLRRGLYLGAQVRRGRCRDTRGIAPVHRVELDAERPSLTSRRREERALSVSSRDRSERGSHLSDPDRLLEERQPVDERRAVESIVDTGCNPRAHNLRAQTDALQPQRVVRRGGHDLRIAQEARRTSGPPRVP
jgi:hypothetical protein